MGTLIVGDMHCKMSHLMPLVDLSIRYIKTGTERVIFLGDYMDDYQVDDESNFSALEVFVEWVEYKRAHGMQIDVLVGNHDLPYFLQRYPFDTSMFLLEEGEVTKLLKDKLHVQAATTVETEEGSVLCTHAGLTKTWAGAFMGKQAFSVQDATDELNAMLYDDRADYFHQIGYLSGGHNKSSSPLWAGAIELQKDAYPGFFGQIVGHTAVNTIKQIQSESGEMLFFCDTLSVKGGEHLFECAIGDGSLLYVNDHDEIGCIREFNTLFNRLVLFYCVEQEVSTLKKHGLG